MNAMQTQTYMYMYNMCMYKRTQVTNYCRCVHNELPGVPTPIVSPSDIS